MTRLFVTLLTLFFLAHPAFAQAPLPDTIATTAEGVVQKTSASLLEPKSKAILQTLDKVTGRTGTATIDVGETVKLGTLYLAVRTCRKAPPIEQPEAAAFVQVWQSVRDQQGKVAEVSDTEWVFSGWMFASSPSVSAMDHPVYDVWVIDCQ